VVNGFQPSGGVAVIVAVLWRRYSCFEPSGIVAPHALVLLGSSVSDLDTYPWLIGTRHRASVILEKFTTFTITSVSSGLVVSTDTSRGAI